MFLVCYVTLARGRSRLKQRRVKQRRDSAGGSDRSGVFCFVFFPGLGKVQREEHLRGKSSIAWIRNAERKISLAEVKCKNMICVKNSNSIELNFQ